MKRFIIIGGFISLVLLIAYCFQSRPSHSGFAGISFISQGFTTNDNGKVLELIAITNSGASAILVTPAAEYQYRNILEWSSDTRPTRLAPGVQVVLPLPDFGRRRGVMCQRISDPRWFHQVSDLLGKYIFNRQDMGMVYAKAR